MDPPGHQLCFLVVVDSVVLFYHFDPRYDMGAMWEVLKGKKRTFDLDIDGEKISGDIGTTPFLAFTSVLKLFMQHVFFFRITHTLDRSFELLQMPKLTTDYLV